MARSCTRQDSKTTNQWGVGRHHQANLTINLCAKSIKNLTNNNGQSRQTIQPHKALKCKYMACNEDSGGSIKVIAKSGTKQLEMKKATSTETKEKTIVF
uniref:60S ribosomal protein L28 n=1 Tax=Elaeophora elaphi TaxID=1147741 RepID=A0A0R3S2A9_9BILA